MARRPWPHISPAVWLAIALVLLAVGGVWAAVWRAGQPWRELEAARARWAAAPVSGYRIMVRMHGWGGCGQEAIVRQERIAEIRSNSCRYHNPRTVSTLFREVERFLRPPELGITCRRGLPGRDCACYAPYQVSVTYAPEGYPQRLTVSLSGYTPNRGHLHYWRYLLRNGREPICGGPLEPAGRDVEVQLFEPLS